MAAKAPLRKKSSANGKSSRDAGSSQRTELLDTRAKNDIVGVVVAIVALVLLVVILVPGEAIGSRAISDVIHALVGIGAYILPFLLMAWSVTFFIRQRLTSKPVRLVIGLSLIFLAITAIAAAMIPGADADAAKVFASEHMGNAGGFLGGALAWLLLTLIGRIAAVIVLVGLLIVGLVVVGFSVTNLIERILAQVGLRRAKAKERDEALNNAAMAPKSAYQMTPPGVAGGAGAQSIPKTRLRGATPLYDTDDDSADAGQLGATLMPTADLGATRRLNRGDDAGSQAEEENIIASSPASDAAAGKAAKAPQAKSQGSKRAGAAASGTAGQPPAGEFSLPDARILRISREKAATKAGVNELRSTAARLQATFEEFGVEGQVIGWISGPTVTLYKVSLGEGVRLNRVTNLQDDIQLALAAQAIRIVAPIPGTSLVGVEIPNDTRNTVLLGDVLPAAQAGPLQLAVGKDVEGDAITADLAAMPHLLIGGTTGSGKSVAINAMIMSILMRATPTEVRMILIDPKRVELSLYNGIPHLYVPVVTDAQQAASALAWAVTEMERRLRIFERHGLKNIKQFNAKAAEELKRLEEEAGKAAASELRLDLGESTGQDDAEDGAGDEAVKANAGSQGDDMLRRPALDIAAEQAELRALMPYLVIVIDELADLMMVAGKDVEASISRLAQLARAAGLHLIVATQRPSTNVITGLIKANIVNRIAFTVASGIDSRVILDTPGAEDLIGSGDLLFSRPEYSKPMRIQGCFVSEPEIETVVEFLQSQGEPDYHEGILDARSSLGQGAGMGEGTGEDDPLLWEAAEIVVSSGLGSTSTLQRRLKVGYARAGRIMDMLEAKGIVGPPNGSKPREVIIDDILDLETLKAME